MPHVLFEEFDAWKRCRIQRAHLCDDNGRKVEAELVLIGYGKSG